MKNVKMWYLTDTCSDVKNLTPTGKIFNDVSIREKHDPKIRWDHISQLCCTVMPGAPY